MNLAPNGKPSNLNAEQYKLVRTPAFKKWFGDWENDAKNSSKVIDENGEPLVVWHSTESVFTVFDKKKIGQNTKSDRKKGFYFSSNKKVSETFITTYKKDDFGFDVRNGYVLPFFVNLKNPNYLDLNTKMGNNIMWADKFIEDNNGENGFIIDNAVDTIGDLNDYSTIIIVPNSNQIKLADGTNTTFDVSNPDIRYKNGGTAKAFTYEIGGL